MGRTAAGNKLTKEKPVCSFTAKSFVISLLFQMTLIAAFLVGVWFMLLAQPWYIIQFLLILSGTLTNQICLQLRMHGIIFYAWKQLPYLCFHAFSTWVWFLRSMLMNPFGSLSTPTVCNEKVIE